MTPETWLVEEPDGGVHEYDPVGERPAGARVLADRSGGAAGVAPRFSQEGVRVYDDLRRRGGSATYSSLYAGYGALMRGVLRDAVADLTAAGVLETVVERQPGPVASVGALEGPQRVLRLRDGWEDLMLVSSWSRVG